MNFSVFGIFKCFIFNFILILKEFGPNRFGWTEPARRWLGRGPNGWTARCLGWARAWRRGRSSQPMWLGGSLGWWRKGRTGSDRPGPVDHGQPRWFIGLKFGRVGFGSETSFVCTTCNVWSLI